MLAAASNCALARAAPFPGIGGGEIGEADVAQRPPADRGAVDPVGAGIGERIVCGGEFRRERPADFGAGGFARRVHRIDIDDGKLVGEKRLARQSQRLGGEGRVFLGVGEGLPHRRYEVGIERSRRRAAPQRFDLVEQCAGRDLLTRLPAREWFGIVHRQKFQPVERYALQLDRGRKAAQQRRHRRRRQVNKAETLPLFGEREDPRPGPAFCLTLDSGRQLGAVSSQEAHRQRDQHRQFVGLPGRRRHFLRDAQLVAAGRRVPAVLDGDLGRARPARTNA